MQTPNIVRDYVDAFCRGDVAGYMASFATDGTYRDPGTPEPLSGDALGTYLSGVLAAFSDMTCETLALEPVSDHAALWRWVLRGTNTGPLQGRPATGRSIELRGCEYIEHDGNKIRQVEGYFDRLTMLVQLGLSVMA